jgi:hypothetical protein
VREQHHSFRPYIKRDLHGFGNKRRRRKAVRDGRSAPPLPPP